MASLAGIRLLLVEDHDDSRDALALWLDHFGATVMQARDAEEALAVLGSEPRPDVILCDIHLPGMDGCALLQRIKGELGLGHVPVIAVTGDPRFGRLKEAGFDALMLKPFSARHIGALILRVLDARDEPLMDHPPSGRKPVEDRDN
jgi:CheY-like chemotaxis protein